MTLGHIPGVSANDALSLEYKLANGNPLRQVDVSYFVGDSALNRFVRTHMSHGEEEFIDFKFGHLSVPHHNAGD